MTKEWTNKQNLSCFNLNTVKGKIATHLNIKIFKSHRISSEQVNGILRNKADSEEAFHLMRSWFLCHLVNRWGTYICSVSKEAFEYITVKNLKVCKRSTGWVQSDAESQRHSILPANSCILHPKIQLQVACSLSITY